MRISTLAAEELFLVVSFYLILSEGTFQTVFSQTCCNNLPETEWLKEQEFILSWCWRPESKNQGTRHSWFLLKALGKNLFYASFLASGGCWQSLTFLGMLLYHCNLFCLCLAFFPVCFSVFSLLCIRTSVIRWCCAVFSRAVMSHSLQPSRLQLARLLCPWGFFREEYQSVSPCPHQTVGPPLIHYDLILTITELTKTYLLIKSHSGVVGRHKLWRNRNQPTILSLGISLYIYADQFSIVLKTGEKSFTDMSSLSQQFSSPWYSTC